MGLHSSTTCSILLANHCITIVLPYGAGSLTEDLPNTVEMPMLIIYFGHRAAL